VSVAAVAMVMVMMVSRAILEVLDRVFLFAAFNGSRSGTQSNGTGVGANFARLSAVVVVSIMLRAAGKGDFAGFSLFTDDERRRWWRFLDNNLLLRRSLADHDRCGLNGRLVVFGFLAPALDVGAAIATLYHTTFHKNFGSIVTALSSLLDAHLGILVDVPIAAAIPVAWRPNFITLTLHNLSLNNGTLAFRTGIPIVVLTLALNNALTLDIGGTAR